MSSITASVPAKWRDNAAFDLVTVNALKSAGIPATFIDRGRIVLCADGTLTSATDGDSTTYTFTPPTPVPPPPDPKDATIADLQAKVEAAGVLVTQLQARATSAENLNDALKHQATASEAQIAELHLTNASLTAHTMALQSRIEAAEASLAKAAAAPAPTESSTPETPAN